MAMSEINRLIDTLVEYCRSTIDREPAGSSHAECAAMLMVAVNGLREIAKEHRAVWAVEMVLGRVLAEADPR
jgi:hypothetical protein